MYQQQSKQAAGTWDVDVKLQVFYPSGLNRGDWSASSSIQCSPWLNGWPNKEANRKIHTHTNLSLHPSSLHVTDEHQSALRLFVL
jgi:hypothetical protein